LRDVQAGATETLAEFAKAHGLAYPDDARLPTQGGLLGEGDLKVNGAATGKLPGDEPGTLCALTYTHRSDDTTHTYHRTAAVLRVPESIGFVPYLGAGRLGTGGHSVKTVDLDGGGSLLADSGVDDAWLTELLSPAFTTWLSRNPDDFAWELADGVLCVSRDGHRSAESELAALCTDAAHIATTIREECLEEVDAGQASRTAAKPKEQTGRERRVDQILSRTTFDHPPTDVASARPQFHSLIVRHPSTYLVSLGRTLVWMVGINIIGGGIYGLLLNLSNPGRAVLIYQLCLFVIVGFLVLRGQINGTTEDLAKEGFWREYARSHGLELEDPGKFAATHAKANLPGTPTRVMSGQLGGVTGALMITGDGFKRGDSIALVGGESGPTASADFDVTAPGASAAALDSYVQRLAGELKTAQSA
jgi:hypothetical protein